MGQVRASHRQQMNLVRCRGRLVLIETVRRHRDKSRCDWSHGGPDTCGSLRKLCCVCRASGRFTQRGHANLEHMEFRLWGAQGMWRRLRRAQPYEQRSRAPSTFEASFANNSEAPDGAQFSERGATTEGPCSRERGSQGHNSSRGVISRLKSPATLSQSPCWQTQR